MDNYALNVALCKALGVRDLESVISVTLRVRATEVPQLTVVRQLWGQNGERIADAVEHLDLVARAPQ